MLIDSYCYIVFCNFDDDFDEVVLCWCEVGVGVLLYVCVEFFEILVICVLVDWFLEMCYFVGVYLLDIEYW